MRSPRVAAPAVLLLGLAAGGCSTSSSSASGSASASSCLAPADPLQRRVRRLGDRPGQLRRVRTEGRPRGRRASPATPCAPGTRPCAGPTRPRAPTSRAIPATAARAATSVPRPPSRAWPPRRARAGPATTAAGRLLARLVGEQLRRDAQRVVVERFDSLELRVGLRQPDRLQLRRDALRRGRVHRRRLRQLTRVAPPFRARRELGYGSVVKVPSTNSDGIGGASE